MLTLLLHVPCCSWEAAAPSPDLSLPPRNTYLPSDFTLVVPAPAAEQPAAEREAAAANGHTAAMEDSPSRAVEALLEGGDAAAFPSPPDLLLDEPGLRCAAAAQHKRSRPAAGSVHQEKGSGCGQGCWRLPAELVHQAQAARSTQHTVRCPPPAFTSSRPPLAHPALPGCGTRWTRPSACRA